MQEKNVIEFYVLCNSLKNLIRTGWKDWGVKKERIESVAEHVYGTQMLAIAMWSEFGYDIDIKKALTMLAVHELEKTKIGDLTMFQIDKESKKQLGHKAIEDILSPLLKGQSIKDLILEFDKRETEEAKFAYYCDKLEADLQCKLYDEANCVNVNKEIDNGAKNDKYVQQLLKDEGSWSAAWLTFGQMRYNYDKNFLKVSNYAKEHNIN